MSARAVIVPLVVSLFAAGTSSPSEHPSSSAESDYVAEVEAWRSGRLARLTSDTGWLTLTALYPLETGSYSLGSSAEADLELPGSAPDRVGTLRVDADHVELEFDAAVPLSANGEPLQSPAAAFDANGDAVLFEIGTVNFFVIQRGDVRLLRVRDREHPDRAHFSGIEHFPVDPAWRFDARFEAHDPVLQIPIANIIGIVSDSPSWGAVVFEHEGETYRIDALAEPGDEELFLIFADATSGKETYGAGRYLYVDAPGDDGRVDLDFNRAYNPPCAFTPYATCPLPPRQNRLPLRIEAGEKNYTDDH